jgi:hypothetical protein
MPDNVSYVNQRVLTKQLIIATRFIAARIQNVSGGLLGPARSRLHHEFAETL